MDNKRILPKLKQLTCPYDPVHRVDCGTRFQRHLVECRKNHPNVEEVACPFNHTHRVKVPELSWHVENCKDNNLHREFIVEKESFDMKFREKLPVDVSIKMPALEDWDSELLVEPVKIPNIAANKNVKFVDSYLLSHMKPRHKKKFRKNLLQGTVKLSTDDDSENEGEPQEEVAPEPQQRAPKAAKAQNGSKPDQNGKPVAPKVLQMPIAANPEMFLNNAGRGLTPSNRQPRIAANIYGQQLPQAMYPAFCPNVVRAHNVGLGRGRIDAFNNGGPPCFSMNTQLNKVNGSIDPNVYISDSEDDDDETDDNN